MSFEYQLGALCFLGAVGLLILAGMFCDTCDN